MDFFLFFDLIVRFSCYWLWFKAVWKAFDLSTVSAGNSLMDCKRAKNTRLLNCKRGKILRLTESAGKYWDGENLLVIAGIIFKILLYFVLKTKEFSFLKKPARYQQVRYCRSKKPIFTLTNLQSNKSMVLILWVITVPCSPFCSGKRVALAASGSLLQSPHHPCWWY